MGYTSVANREEAVRAAAALFARERGAAPRDAVGDALARFPLAIDQVMAEAGVVEPRVAARAYVQAEGDLARAVSLVRAWSANLTRVAHARTSPDAWHLRRRITPAYVDPPGGQYLGASRDYERRLLRFDDATDAIDVPDANASGGANADTPDVAFPGTLARASRRLALDDLVAASEPIVAVDATRASVSRAERGAYLQTLARAETGAITALAYAGIRGHGQRQDPTLVELRVGDVPVRVARPDTGGLVDVGTFVATYAEVALYAMHQTGDADPAFTLGVGVTPGRVERRAIASAMLDAAATRARADDAGSVPAHDDREFVSIAVDGQESAGFVEHLKLPHHVTFASDLDRVRAARVAMGGAS